MEGTDEPFSGVALAAGFSLTAAGCMTQSQYAWNFLQLAPDAVIEKVDPKAYVAEFNAIPARSSVPVPAGLLIVRTPRDKDRAIVVVFEGPGKCYVTYVYLPLATHERIKRMIEAHRRGV
jgi:hypothetical protein